MDPKPPARVPRTFYALVYRYRSVIEKGLVVVFILIAAYCTWRVLL